VSHNTDIFVASDHGFSTVGRPIELREGLKSAGFRVTFDGETAGGRGHVRVVGNGGTALFYIAEHDEDTTARLTEWLQQSDFAGVIFSPSAREGAFLYSEAHLETPSAPDLVMAFCWADQPNKHGLAGIIAATAAGEAVPATHGTLGKFDVHNTLIAAGPDFRAGTTDELPTSNLDVAPTILHLLGINRCSRSMEECSRKLSLGRRNFFPGWSRARLKQPGRFPRESGVSSCAFRSWVRTFTSMKGMAALQTRIAGVRHFFPERLGRKSRCLFSMAAS